MWEEQSRSLLVSPYFSTLHPSIHLIFLFRRLLDQFSPFVTATIPLRLADASISAASDSVIWSGIGTVKTFEEWTHVSSSNPVLYRVMECNIQTYQISWSGQLSVWALQILKATQNHCFDAAYRGLMRRFVPTRDGTVHSRPMVLIKIFLLFACGSALKSMHRGRRPLISLVLRDYFWVLTRLDMKLELL